MIIVTHNGERWIENCLSSIHQSLIPVKTVIIDNASSDGTLKIVAEKYPEVTVLRSQQNIGFGKANNIGIRYAMDNQADFLFLLNQDAWILPDTLQKLLKAYEQHTHYGILSPVHLNGTGDRIDRNFFLYTSRNHHENLWYDFFLQNGNDLYNVESVNAAAWFVSRECIEKAGCFNPIFTHYGEDDNYCDRTLYHGFKIGIVPAARIYHDRDYDRTEKTDFYTDKQEHLIRSGLLRNVLNINKEFDRVYAVGRNVFIKNSISHFLQLRWRKFGKECVSLFHWRKSKQLFRNNRMLSKQPKAFY